jgi:hypothetical protein
MELRRLLWRYEYRRLSPLRMKRELRAEYLRSSRGFHALAGSVPAVRQHDPSLLAARDTFLARADAAINTGRYREALDHAFRGRSVLASMQALADADTRVREAAALVERLQDLARTPWLRRLPCVSAPAGLLALARQHMGHGRYGQARHLAAASLAEAAPMARRERLPAGRAAALERRLAELRALCAETSALSGDAAEDPLADGSLDAAAALARDGYLALTERLADETAFSLADRGRFHRELRRAGGAEDTAMLGGEARGGWASATAALWRARVESALRRAGTQRERLDHARAALGPPSAGGEPGPRRTNLPSNQQPHGERPR